MIRAAKPGSDWMNAELRSLEVNIEHRKATEFFGREVGSIDHLDPNLLLPVDGPIYRPNVSKETSRFLMNLKLAFCGNPAEASNEVLTIILEMMGYDGNQTILRRNHELRFNMSGKSTVTTSDVCLYHSSTMVLLVARTLVDTSYRPQIIADAVAAFAWNNAQRAGRHLPRLDSMVIPAITMIGLRPCFYKISVTQRLCDAVAWGQSPEESTNVTCCIPPRLNGLVDMRDAEYREVALQYFDAFLEISKDCWSQITNGF